MQVCTLWLKPSPTYCHIAQVLFNSGDYMYRILQWCMHLCEYIVDARPNMLLLCYSIVWF